MHTGAVRTTMADDLCLVQASPNCLPLCAPGGPPTRYQTPKVSAIMTLAYGNTSESGNYGPPLNVVDQSLRAEPSEGHPQHTSFYIWSAVSPTRTTTSKTMITIIDVWWEDPKSVSLQTSLNMVPTDSLDGLGGLPRHIHTSGTVRHCPVDTRYPFVPHLPQILASVCLGRPPDTFVGALNL